MGTRRERSSEPGDANGLRRVRRRSAPWPTPWLRATTLAALAVASSAARAEAPLDPVVIARYEVAPACPAQSEFEASLDARLRAPPSDVTVSLAVAIHDHPQNPPPERYRGELGMTPAGDARTATPQTQREVHGATCREVVEALSLIAALSLEASPSAPQPSLPSDERARTAPTAPPEPTRDAAPERGAPAHATNAWTLGPLAFALAQTATAPGWSPALGVGISLSPPTRSGSAPLLLLGVYGMPTQEARLEGTNPRGRIDLLAAYFAACPWRWPASTRAGLRPCLDLDLGRMTGRGFGGSSSFTRRGLWASVGLGVSGEVNLAGPLWLSGLVAGALSLTAHEFFFAPDYVIYEVPWLGLRAGAFLSLRL